MGYRTWNAYEEDAERARKALPLHQRYAWDGIAIVLCAVLPFVLAYCWQYLR